jgi:hypothetical protein
MENIWETIFHLRRASRALEELVKNGADRKALLGLLSDAVHPYDPSRIRALRYKLKELARLASELDVAGKRAEQVFADPVLDDALSGGILLISRAPIIPAELEAIRECAKNARENARAQRSFLAEYQRNALRWQIGRLTEYVQQSTGNTHYRQIAILLTTALAAVGRPKKLSECAVQKARQRLLVSVRNGR